MRVAIGVIVASLLGSSVNAGAVTAADKAAAYSTSGAGGGAALVSNARQASARQANTTQYGVDFSGNAAGTAKLRNVKTSGVYDDRRLASLDPSQIVYSQMQGYPQGFAQAPGVQASLLDLSNSRLFPRQDLRPAALHHARTFEDFFLMGFVAVMLIVYQLRKKHRFLRPHPFSY